MQMSSYDYFDAAQKFAETNYQETIDRISRTRFEDMLPSKFFAEYIWAVYVSGFRASTISKLWDRLLDAYDGLCIMGDANTPEELANVKQKALALFRNERKVDAIIKCADMIRCGINEMGWERFRDEQLTTPELLQKLPFIGKITRYHLARNIGLLQYVKPDVHLERMSRYWGYHSPQVMCAHLGICAGREPRDPPLQPGIVDLILWYAASTFGTRSV